MIFLLLWFVFAGVSFAQANNATAQDDVKIAQIPDGGYSVTTTSYQAKIGADGNLHSFCINGVEFIDDHTAASMGVSFFVEQPIPLPQQHLDRNVLTATDGVYTAKYTFEAGYVIIAIRHTNPKGAAYVAVCTPRVAFTEDLTANTVAASPVNFHWSDVKVSVPTGESLEFHGGSRVWGREIERQVWERSNIAPNRDYQFILVPGRDAPPTPTLGQLTTLSATMSHPDQLIPAGEQAQMQVRFDNNSNTAITTEMIAHVESSAGKVIFDDRKPLAADSHQSVTLPWAFTTDVPDFYKVQISVNLEGTPKILLTTFGYNIPAILAPTQYPDDFTAYWGRVVAEANAAPVHLSMLEDSSRSTNATKVYEIAIEADGQTCSGWLSIPRYPGRYPGLLVLPSDRQRSIGPNPSLAELGFLVMSIEPSGQSVRSAVNPLISRASVNLATPALFGMRAIIIRCLRAVTALSTVAEVDPNRLAVTGAGLGGSMALIVAALDDRIQAAAADVPYYCNIGLGREKPSWPYLEVASFIHDHPDQQDEVMQTLSYYDVANFAKTISCPILISAGLDDPYSMPKNIVSVYNQLTGPHALMIYPAGHEGGGIKHWEEKVRWLTRTLGGPGPVLPTLPVQAVPTPTAASPIAPTPAVPIPPAQDVQGGKAN